MRYVIEHRSRGVFIVWAYEHGKSRWMPKFKWSVLRDKGRSWTDRLQAERELAKINAIVPDCYIVELSR